MWDTLLMLHPTYHVAASNSVDCLCCCNILQVHPELRLWQQLSAELVRQTHLECSQRGQLLQAAIQRQQELLQQALDSCDALYRAMKVSAAAQLQQQECMVAAQAESNALQQDNTRLKVRIVSGSIHLWQCTASWELAWRGHVHSCPANSCLYVRCGSRLQATKPMQQYSCGHHVLMCWLTGVRRDGGLVSLAPPPCAGSA
jgi:hypothetical protein